MNSSIAKVDLARKSAIGQVVTIAILSICVMSYFSGLYGFLSPDSWGYLLLSKSLINGEGCRQYGEYSAVFPCGYPLLISAISYFGGIESLLVASKIANLVLLLLSFFLVYKASNNNIIMALVFVCNPVTDFIFHYTWSENLFLFAVISTMYCINTIKVEGYRHSLGVFLLFSLVVGCSSRYFFAPFSIFIFISAYFVYGYGLAKKIFPFFAAAGLFFIGYYLLNQQLTGYGSGIERISAPESLTFLFLAFFKSISQDAALIVLCAIPVICLVVWSFFKKKFSLRDVFKSSGNSFSWFMLLIGVSYLVLAFVMRVYSQFDLYGTRTIGYGIVFVFSSVLAIAAKEISIDRKFVIAAAVSCALSVLFSQPRLYLNAILSGDASDYVVFSEAMKSYHSKIDTGGVVVSFTVPAPSRFVASNSDIYYSGSAGVVMAKAAPYSTQETFLELRRRILEVGANKCSYDFSNIKNDAALGKIVDGMYQVDISFEKGVLKPIGEYKYRYDDELRGLIKSVFDPGKYVACKL